MAKAGHLSPFRMAKMLNGFLIVTGFSVYKSTYYFSICQVFYLSLGSFRGAKSVGGFPHQSYRKTISAILHGKMAEIAA